MRCEKFDSRLNDLLDERLRPQCDAELLSHAEGCERCRERLVVQEQLFCALETLEVPPLRASFARDAVAAAIVLEAKPVKPRGSSWLAAAIGIGATIAAALLIAIVPVVRWLAVPQMPVVEKPAAPIQVAPDNAVADHPAPPVERAANRPMTIYPEDLAQMAKDADELLTSQPPGEVMRNLSTRLPEESIPGLRPIAGSLNLTIGMMRRTLPVATKETRPTENKVEPPSKPQADYSRDERAALVS